MHHVFFWSIIYYIPTTIYNILNNISIILIPFLKQIIETNPEKFTGAGLACWGYSSKELGQHVLGQQLGLFAFSRCFLRWLIFLKNRERDLLVCRDFVDFVDLWCSYKWRGCFKCFKGIFGFLGIRFFRWFVWRPLGARGFLGRPRSTKPMLGVLFTPTWAQEMLRMSPNPIHITQAKRFFPYRQVFFFKNCYNMISCLL